jgi:UDP-N-acetylglucosamine 4-epimerase
VAGLDNFATGQRANLDGVRALVGEQAWKNFSFIEGDIRDTAACQRALKGAELVLHQAALGSVPRSIDNPLETNSVNVTGFVNVFMAAREAGAKRLIYASSSSVYGAAPGFPRKEDQIPQPLSPYAVSKYANELYAASFCTVYSLPAIGLRYFNVFGPRQNPQGEYAAVVPRWIAAMRDGQECTIFGDGTTSRDFCYVDNVVQANLLAALSTEAQALNQVFNVAVSAEHTLKELYSAIRSSYLQINPAMSLAEQPKYACFRNGDVRRSLADISKAQKILGYSPENGFEDGINKTVYYFLNS